MNELTLSLLAIGLGLIVLLVTFNWWQERKIRKASEKLFSLAQAQGQVLTDEEIDQEEELTGEYEEPQVAHISDDSLLDDEVDFKIDINEVSPEPHADTEDLPAIWLAPELESEPELQLVSAQEPPAKTLPEALSVDVDLIALISLSAAEKGERLRHMLMRLLALDKPVFAYGLTERLDWQALNREQEAELFSKVAYSLQLADRSGAASEDTLKRFQNQISSIAYELGGQAEWVGAGDPPNFAKELDDFCMEVDQLVNLHIINGASGRFMGTKLNSLCGANGLSLQENGVFHATDEAGQVLFALVNVEKNPFKPDMLKTTTLKGATFQMDIARTPNCTETFNQMVNMAKNMATSLNGVLVDDHQRELSDAQLEKIRQQLKLIQVQMTVKGIAPGTPLALRLFS